MSEPMLEQILQYQETYTAPDALLAQANLPDFDAEYARSVDDPAAFWGEWATLRLVSSRGIR
ncbi:MAG: hypothetical protein R2838_01505 [Caldilineaceae bacterium]